MSRDSWAVPRLWPGETVAIAGGGPSLTAGQLAHVRGRARLLVVNDGYRLAPWADWLHGCDVGWWMNHHQGVKDAGFGGIRTTMGETVPAQWGVCWQQHTGADGFDPDPARVRHGKNGVYQAMHNVVHAGAARILLLGVDMRRGADGRSHWFGEHAWSPAPVDYASVMLPHFPTLIGPLAERGVEVFNCTPGSALTCFPMARLEDVLP